MALDILGRVLQSSHTLTQSEWQQGDGEGVGQLDHSTGSPSEQPPLWLRAARGQLLCGSLQCVAETKDCAGCIRQVLFTRAI